MSKLIGTNPNQVPTNADLGTMAYMDYDSVAPALIGGRRNLIINGAMQVAQRGTSFPLGSDAYTLDRVRYDGTGVTGGMTLTQDSDTPSGFSSSLKVECTSASSNSTSERARLLLGQLERQDATPVYDKEHTFSFYVKASQTGVIALFIGAYRSSSVAHYCVRTVTIESSDTWERKTVTLPACPDSSIEGATELGYRVELYMNAGSNFTSGSSLSDWSTSITDDQVAVGHTFNVMENAGDYINITGVQLEVGSVATPFEHRSYGEELALCQRYLFKHSGTPDQSRYSYGENFHYFYPVEMRTQATISGANASVNRRFTDGVTFNPYTGNLGLFSADAEL